MQNDAQKVHYFVLNTLADWEASYALAMLNTPAGVPLQRYRVVTVAASREPIVTMGGLRIVPDLTLAELSPADSALLVLPGGQTWETGENQAAIDKAREFLHQDKPVAAICGATWAMARGGLLDERKHTSNQADYLVATGYRGGAHYVNERAVSDRKVITAGATGALEFAREIFLTLGYYPRPVVEAWYQLYRTGDPRYFAELVQAMSPA